MSVMMLVLIFLPATAAGALLLLDPKAPAERARWAALIATIATFLLSWGLASQYAALPKVERSARGPIHPQLVTRFTWLDLSQAAPNGPPLKFEFFLGVDGISVAMILVTTILSISSVLVSWNAIKDRAAEFYAWLLILETASIGVFCSFDIMLFYVFFEFTLIPFFFLVGIWGGVSRRYAAGKFFMYMLAGGLVTLLGLVSLAVTAVKADPNLKTPFAMPDLAASLQLHPIEGYVSVVLFMMISAGFLVKLPILPFHTWLPLFHQEAPAAGSVLLVKLGLYGVLRLLLPLLPYPCEHFGFFLIGTVASVGVVYGSFCALAQNDFKKLIAYGSVAHLGVSLLGLFALNSEGICGGVLQMVNLGFSTGALFCIVAMIYERFQTRQLSDLGGLATKLPLLSVSMVIAVFASIGLPGLNGFVGEFLCLAGMFKSGGGQGVMYTAAGALGVILGAWYLLGAVQTVFFGPVKVPSDEGRAAQPPVTDLNAREVATLLPLLSLCVILGLFPQPLIDLIRSDVDQVAGLYGDVHLKREVISMTTPLPSVTLGSEDGK